MMEIHNFISYFLSDLHDIFSDLFEMFYSFYSLKIIFTLFVTDVTPWVVTSVITSFGVNIEWTGQDSTRLVVYFHSTGVRIEWNSLLNE